jgi:hypothetical protein
MLNTFMIPNFLRFIIDRADNAAASWRHATCSRRSATSQAVTKRLSGEPTMNSGSGRSRRRRLGKRRRIPERRADNPPCTKRPRGRIWGSRERLASRAYSRASRPTWTPCPFHPLAQPPSQPTEPPSVRSGGSRPQESRAGEIGQARVSHSQCPTCCDARKERTRSRCRQNAPANGQKVA